MPKKKSKKKQEEVCEIVEIKDKKKQVKFCGKQEEAVSKKGQVKKENKMLRNILIVLGILIVLFIVVIYLFNTAGSFDYRGVKFKMVKMGDLLLYNTKIPLVSQNTNYNFYLRNDPRDIEEQVPFDIQQDFIVYKNIVIQSEGEEEFKCEGYGLVATANLISLYKVLGADVIKDENASCDPEHRYMHISLKDGEETRIEQESKSCYTIYIADCEILEGTERMMNEIFVLHNDVKIEQNS